jgi:hypothetical protein
MQTQSIEKIDPREVPLASKPADPGWTENYCNQMYSPGNDVGIWTHLSAVPGTSDLWREVWIAYLPGDRFIVAKGHGRGASDRGPGGSTLFLCCEESYKRWRMSFNGAARDVSGAELRSGPLADGAHVAVQMELSWEGITPGFDYGKWMGQQAWGNAHFEQPCRVSGQLVVGDERWDLVGTGIRDHSRGPRFYGSVLEDWWLTGQFPSGRTFGVLEVTNIGDDKPLLSHGFVTDGDNVEPLEFQGVELVNVTDDGTPLEYRIRVRHQGREQVIEARLLAAMPIALGEPNDIILGAAYPAVPLALTEAQTEFRWNEEVGYGLTERSRTLDRNLA